MAVVQRSAELVADHGESVLVNQRRRTRGWERGKVAEVTTHWRNCEGKKDSFTLYDVILDRRGSHGQCIHIYVGDERIRKQEASNAA